jgi:hypothetical protein
VFNFRPPRFSYDFSGERAMRSHKLRLGFVLLLTMSWLSPVVAQERRIALVIGNSNYDHVARLPNAEEDAIQVAANLGKIGYQVTRALNANSTELPLKIQRFKDELAKGAAVALVYYSGHGIEASGRQFMVPVDAKPTSELRSDDFDLVALIDDAVVANPKLTASVFDACRTEFVPSRSTSVKPVGPRGLKRVGGSEVYSGETGEFLRLYSTARSGRASDGDGHISPFTESILRHMTEPNLSVVALANRVKSEVDTKTSGRQRGESHASARALNYSLNRKSGPLKHDLLAVEQQSCDELVVEAETSENIELSRRYLKFCPNHGQADQVRRKLALAGERDKCKELLGMPKTSQIDLEYHLRRYPDGLCETAARKRLAELLEQGATGGIPSIKPAKSIFECRQFSFIEGQGYHRTPIPTSSAEACRQLCDQDKRCRMFEFYKPMSNCNLFDAAKIGSVPGNSKSVVCVKQP